MLLHSVAGGAAAIALLSGGLEPLGFAALSRDALAQEGVSIESRDRRWRVDGLSGKAYDRLKDRARDDREFEKIRDHFAGSRAWSGKGRNAWRAFYRDSRVRDVYVQVFASADASATAFVVYGEEDGGKEWNRGFVLRSGRVTDEFYVKNGNLRNEDGRVGDESSDVGIEAGQPGGGISIDDCAIDTFLCATVAALGCYVTPGVLSVLCGSAYAACVARSEVILAFICGGEWSSINSACKEWASEGKCS